MPGLGGSRARLTPRWASEAQHSHPVPSALPAPLPDSSRPSSRHARTLRPLRSPSGPAGQGGPRPHTHLAAGSAGPARGQGPIPRRIRRLTAQPRGRGAGGTPERPRPGPPCPEANRRARSRVTSRVPRGQRSPRAWAARSRRRRRAEVELKRLREPCEGKEASVTGQRRSRSKQKPAACPEQRSGSTPGWPRCGLPMAYGAP